MPGPADAITELVRAHGRSVYAVCARLDPDADDAYQAVWERVWSAWATYDPARGPARPWLMALTHRLLTDRHRRRAVRPRGHLAAVEPDVLQGARSPEREVGSARTQARLRACVDRLPDDQRRAVVGLHLEGLSVAELAELEGVAPGTIKSRLHRGRAQLARWMKEGGWTAKSS